MRPSGRVHLLATAALVMMLAAGCTEHSASDGRGTTVGETAQKNLDSRGRRTDPAPLTNRFPVIGTPEGVVWMSGDTGSGGPGPTTYWIDAVVTLSPAAAADLRAHAGALRPDPAYPTDRFYPAMRAELPAGTLSTSVDLSRYLGGGKRLPGAGLSADGRTLVIQSMWQ